MVISKGNQLCFSFLHPLPLVTLTRPFVMPTEESPTLDLLRTYGILEPPIPMTSVDRGSVSPEREPALRVPVPFRSENLSSRSSVSSFTSASNLVTPNGTRQRHVKQPSRSSPFYWNWPSQHVLALEEKRAQVKHRRERPTKWYHGWKVILFGSCERLSSFGSPSAKVPQGSTSSWW